MPLKNSETRYGSAAMALHWIMALGFIGMVVLGVYMHELPNTDPSKFTLFQWHKSVGLTLLLLVALRLLWRALNTVPPLPTGLKPYERFLAHLTHRWLYAAFFLMPLTGWTMVSASPYNIPTMVYGLFEWPHIPFVASAANKEGIMDIAKEAHEIVALLAVLALLLHIGAAVKHHFILKDDVLRRMLPQWKNKG